ncbi:hypothetical protein Q2Y23_002747 [Vibrio fluvialis]|nr:hypothetical protein [Vibrio fluvialis]ELM6621783.1 hypothetical protein [Vibrio fluvialis]
MKLMSAFLTAVCTLSASPLSWACSYDGQFSNPFAESYPGALDVAMATQEALNTQTISVPTKLEGEKGLRRATWWLHLLVSQNSDALMDSYIYLVDSQLWAHYDANSKLTVHSLPPEANQKVMQLTEIALHNIVSKKLSLKHAEKLGLVLTS